MSHEIDECYPVYTETVRRAAKEHTCSACHEPISKGDTYTSVFIVWEGRGRQVKRCSRCQTIHKHLRDIGDGDMWPDEELNCGEEYSDHWGKEPPEHIAALAFWRPGDPLPKGPTP